MFKYVSFRWLDIFVGKNVSIADVNTYELHRVNRLHEKQTL